MIRINTHIGAPAGEAVISYPAGDETSGPWLLLNDAALWRRENILIVSSREGIYELDIDDTKPVARETTGAPPSEKPAIAFNRRVLISSEPPAKKMWFGFLCFRRRLQLGALAVYVEGVLTLEVVRELASLAYDLNDADDYFSFMRGHEAFGGIQDMGRLRGGVDQAMEIIERALARDGWMGQGIAARAARHIAEHAASHHCFHLTPDQESLIRRESDRMPEGGTKDLLEEAVAEIDRTWRVR
jgi:hypothetical protein